jgi:hypothetical protein
MAKIHYLYKMNGYSRRIKRSYRSKVTAFVDLTSLDDGELVLVKDIAYMKLSKEIPLSRDEYTKLYKSPYENYIKKFANTDFFISV